MRTLIQTDNKGIRFLKSALELKSIDCIVGGSNMITVEKIDAHIARECLINNDYPIILDWTFFTQTELDEGYIHLGFNNMIKILESMYKNDKH